MVLLGTLPNLVYLVFAPSVLYTGENLVSQSHAKVSGHANEHRHTGWVSLGGGGGGGLKSLARIYFSIACTKIKWFCPNITWFLKWLFENSSGVAAPPPPQPHGPYTYANEPGGQFGQVWICATDPGKLDTISLTNFFFFTRFLLHSLYHKWIIHGQGGNLGMGWDRIEEVLFVHKLQLAYLPFLDIPSRLPSYHRRKYAETSFHRGGGGDGQFIQQYCIPPPPPRWKDTSLEICALCFILK